MNTIDEVLLVCLHQTRFSSKATQAERGRKQLNKFLGSYLWEYNRTCFGNTHAAFLKGRVAIVNNDKAELKTQATFIRTQNGESNCQGCFGATLTNGKAVQRRCHPAHTLSERGLGFIYSLRYCTINGADSNFSDAILAWVVIDRLRQTGSGILPMTKLTRHQTPLPRNSSCKTADYNFSRRWIGIFAGPPFVV